MEVIIEPSTRKTKKFKATFSNGQVTHFGAQGYDDYTLTKNDTQKMLYRRRHMHDPHNPTSAGELSRTILWSKKTLHQAGKEYERLHNIKVKFRL